MAKIRLDLVGAIHVAGHVLYAGDTVPDGVTLSPEHIEAEKPKRQPRKAKAEQDDDAAD